MKSWIWLIVAAVGWGIMLAGYSSRARLDPGAPWSSGFLVIGPVEAQEKASGKPAETTAPGPKATTPETPAKEGAFPGEIPVRVRLLSKSSAAEMLLIAFGDEAPQKGVG